MGKSSFLDRGDDLTRLLFHSPDSMLLGGLMMMPNRSVELDHDDGSGFVACDAYSARIELLKFLKPQKQFFVFYTIKLPSEKFRKKLRFLLKKI